LGEERCDSEALEMENSEEGFDGALELEDSEHYYFITITVIL